MTEVQYFVAATHNIAFSNLPFYITAIVSVGIFKNLTETIYSYATYYMVLTGNLCDSTLEISNGNNSFRQIVKIENFRI